MKNRLRVRLAQSVKYFCANQYALVHGIIKADLR
jgi:hypothetical protein